jgi:hypothetical protein
MLCSRLAEEGVGFVAGVVVEFSVAVNGDTVLVAAGVVGFPGVPSGVASQRQRVTW